MAMSGKYNILKKTFDKYVLKEGNNDSREPEDFLRLEPTVDSRGRYFRMKNRFIEKYLKLV